VAQFIKVVRDIALLVGRLGLGGILVVHGMQRWSGGVDAQVARVDALGLPSPTVFAWGTIALEVVGGILLVFGLATPIVAALVVIEQGLIIGLGKVGNGPLLAEGGYEYNVAIGCLALIFLAFGSGRAGVDALFLRGRDDDGEPAISDYSPA